jgi:hypothetical protein
MIEEDKGENVSEPKKADYEFVVILLLQNQKEQRHFDFY